MALSGYSANSITAPLLLLPLPTVRNLDGDAGEEIQYHPAVECEDPEKNNIYTSCVAAESLFPSTGGRRSARVFPGTEGAHGEG